MSNDGVLFLLFLSSIQLQIIFDDDEFLFQDVIGHTVFDICDYDLDMTHEWK